MEAISAESKKTVRIALFIFSSSLGSYNYYKSVTLPIDDHRLRTADLYMLETANFRNIG